MEVLYLPMELVEIGRMFKMLWRILVYSMDRVNSICGIFSSERINGRKRRAHVDTLSVTTYVCNRQDGGPQVILCSGSLNGSKAVGMTT